jgi:hypothetical protein
MSRGIQISTFTSFIQLTHLVEMFRFYLANKQCKHIVFGGCHDTGYLTILEQYKHDIEKANRITLLETIPAQSGFYALNFKMARFSNVFRSEPLERMLYLPHLQAQQLQAPQLQAQQSITPSTTGVSSPIISSKAPSIVTPESSPPQAKKALGTPVVKAAVAATKTPQPTRTPLAAKAEPPASWASAAVTNGITDKNFTIATRRQKPAVPRFILFTEKGYRLDSPLPPSSSNDIHNLHALMEKGKLCNEHFLKGKCQSSKCHYMHTGKLSAGEINALKHKARKISCPEKIDCNDYGCYFGHVCPYEKGGKCTKENCNFLDVHGIDRVC